MDYKPPYFLFNAHLETIYPSLLRKVNCEKFVRERIVTPDNDFLDLDWLRQNSSRLMIISHGLEGNSKRPYVLGMARAGFEKGFDILAWNYRGCSEEINKQLRFYHSGATDDLDVVVQHAVQSGYKQIYLVGFSLGGNLTLKYLGEKWRAAPIEKAVTFSVPLDLHSSCVKISQPGNWIYANRFLKSLKKKIITKSLVKPELDTTGIEQIKTLIDFDDRFTAPIHGFQNAVDYYTKSSSLHYLASIEIPTLIINAKNDPFLTEQCYPVNLIKDHPFVRFESPGYGGHVGFAQFRKNGLYWSEERALDFLLMIDRYSITATTENIRDRFNVDLPHALLPHYNASPTQLLPVITHTASQGVSVFYWGTSPEWSKNKSLSEKIINVHREAIQERAALQKTMMKTRCIVPADGFYAWKQAGKKTFIPFRFVCTDQELFSFAGLWEEYEDTDGNQIQTFSIITVPANPLVETVHGRMPVILNQAGESIWLSKESQESELLSVLTPYPAAGMNHYTVSPKIRETSLNVPSLIRPTPASDQFGNLTLFD